MATSPISFQGLGTGLQTDSLVAAILAQEGKSVQAWTDRQARNKVRTTALTSIKTAMNTLSVGLAAFQDKLDARTVTSSDTTNAYVTGTATNAVAGNYDLKVSTVATRARISSNMAGVPLAPTNLAVADPAAVIFSSGKASFGVQGTDGVIKTFELTNNSLNGLRDAINASGAAVQATIVNTGSGSNPYQLVVTAKDTGTGTNGGTIQLTALDNADASITTLDPALGIGKGTLGGTFAAPTSLTGGLTSAVANDAVFTLNGIQLTRKSNIVTDAADGVTFTLKQGGQTGTTTLTVAPDKAGASQGMQDVVTKFNALVKLYADGSKATQDPNGTILPGPLTGDTTARSIISQMRVALTSTTSGVAAGSSYSSFANMGLRTLSDGTLSLDTSAFQTAFEKDPGASKRLDIFSGTSNLGAVAVTSGNAKSPTGSVTFTIDTFAAGGAVSGTFSGVDAQGNAFSNIRASGANGVVSGAAGTALEGLSLTVTALGSGTLSLARGPGQKVRDLVSALTASGTGSLANVLANIDSQNKALTSQISAGQSALDRREKVLKLQFSKMETAIAQMKASGGNLNAAR